MKPVRNKLFTLFSYSVFFTLLLCQSSYAASQNDDNWHIMFAPYGWLAGLDGSVSTLPGLPPADINLDFWDDIVGNIDGAFFLVGEVRKGRFGVFTDFAYVDIEQDADTSGPLFSSVDLTTENRIVSVAGLYRLVGEQSASLDCIAGIRYWSVDTTLGLRAGFLPGREISHKEEWVDPLVGMKGLASLGDSQFYVSGGLAIGGFGSGSDFMWDASVNFGYQWGEMFSTTIGYRYLDVDYEDDGFLYDVAQHGPVLGLVWQFL